MEVALLNFVRQCKRLAKQALGKHAGEPASGGIARWKHVVLHCLRIEDEYTYRELIDRLSLMTDIRKELELDPDDLPDPSTVCKAFDRYKMWVWRQLLRQSAQQLGGSGHVALDSTFFDRGHASAYYRTRSDRSVETLKVTTLTDMDSLAVLDVQCYAQWRHDTQTGPQIVRRNADDLHTVAADNGFQDWHTEYEIAALDLDYLVHYRGSSLMATANNALIRSKGYSQRWMAETSYSTTKRSLSDAVRALDWYRQFREIVLMFAITNIESLCEPL